MLTTIKKQYYGIKFPFTNNSPKEFFIDLNETIQDKVSSEIAHVILTPKGSRLRKPDFGTDLVKYIFEPSDDMTWDGVRDEVINAVGRYVANVEIKTVEVVPSEMDDYTYYIDMVYAYKKGTKEENNRMVIKI